ncbi:MAG: hypothetical protein A2X27_03450 [Chloroflexi bacterium GWD2_49_16]|nr:MAG: hypothetical protein A2X26_07915 [Chloroflexi bacterium GWC2_49_37]OGN85353.1 MAG: hypothetical protein A2X27_03450 [Chloroflexi bacterium GWD2_49_16]HBG73843.1 hypothetical protein [Anaerolineae bacterium]HCC79433.1 hypothetical protein [Anaerolineae bacterium]HCM97636.1 hypothetical protein [Anaerolineae bacterium]
MPTFIKHTSGLQLRPYQIAPIARLHDSIRNRYGDTIIIVFPRQSGKDEFLIQLMVYMLYIYSQFPLSMVAVNPTYKPQTVNALIRFDQVLARNPLTSKLWRKHGDFIRRVDQTRISFLSGDLKSNILGATASLLLMVNEAQDISPTLFQHKLFPMAASTHATCLLAGTLWTSTTFLSQEIRHARYFEKLDDRKRVFMVDADHVRQVLPAYGAHVDSVVARWGRQHPLVKTQYFNEEIDATTGMFNAARMSLIFGSPHLNSPPIFDSQNGGSWRGAENGGSRRGVAFLIDLAGQDEAVMADPAAKLANPSRDSAALSIAEVDTSTVETLNYPTYRILHRVEWTGQNHLTVFGQIKSLAESWRPRYLVVDATGVGEGLWALLDKAFPGKVIPVKFTATVKSEIGYRFLAMINTGRFCVREQSPQAPASFSRDATVTHPGARAPGSGMDNSGERASGEHRPCSPQEGQTSSRQSSISKQVEAQYMACQCEVLPGPGKTLRWGVPEGTRDPEGALIHDDYVLADALVTLLDDLDWSLSSPTLIIDRDILDPKNDNTDLLHFIDHNY